MGKNNGFRTPKKDAYKNIFANNPQEQKKRELEEKFPPTKSLSSEDVTMLLSPANCRKNSSPIVGVCQQIITLRSRAQYDSLNPEETIRTFTAFAKSVVTRYEENDRLVGVYDKETQDVLHYIELSGNMSAPKGFIMYKKLREIRRNRRRCKNENDLLEPVYQLFKQEYQDLPSKLSAVQGRCKTLKAGIDSRQYTLRTGVMDS